MPIDPSIPLQAQQLKLETPMNQLAMAGEMMKIGEYKQASEERNFLRNRMAQGNFDIADPTHRQEIMAGAPTVGGKFLSDTASMQKNLYQGEKFKEEIDTSRFDKAINHTINEPNADAAAKTIMKGMADKSIPMDKGQSMLEDLKVTPFASWTTKTLKGLVGAREQFVQDQTNKRAQATLNQADSHFKQRLAQETATGALTPETTDLLAQTYIKTGTLPPLGMGKAAAGLRQTILNRAAQISMGGGANPDGTVKPNVSAEDAASNIVQNKSSLIGNRASERTLGTNLANIVAAGSEAEKMINIAQTYATKINPTDYPVINTAGNYIAKNSGDPTQAGLATSLNSLVNAYARAINPKGVATVSDKNHAREVINTSMASGQFNEVFSVMRQEMAAAQAAPEEARAKIRGTGGKETITAKKISNDADYNALPSGVEFIAPDGSHRRKP